jgi:two-component sensor histidine kinase
MAVSQVGLQETVRAIAERWSEPAATVLGGAAPEAGWLRRWLPMVQAALQAGEADDLLTAMRGLGRQARRDGVTPEATAGAVAALTGAIVRLAAQAGVGAEGELWMLTGAAVQAAALGAYTEPTTAPPASAAGDLAGRLARMEAIHRINRAANSSLQLTAMLDLVVEAVADVIGSDTCSIWTYHEESDELVLRAARGLNPEAIGRVRLRMGQAITGEAARSRQPIAARDARAHPAYQYIALLGEEKYQSQVSVPILRYSVDRLVGVVTLKTIEPRTWDNDDLRFLRTVAGELAIAIENAQLYQQTDARLREKVRELATLQRVSARMAETLDLGGVLEIIAYNAAELGRAERVDIIRVDRETGEPELVASYSRQEGELSERRVQAVRDLIREVVSKVSSTQVEPGGLVALTSAQRPIEPGDRFSIFGMPLRTMRGVLGGICLHYSEDGGPSDDLYNLLSSFANAAAIAIENAQLYAEAQRNLTVKSALLQEMHHRVRNNLQTVAGLLRMQMRRSKEQNHALQESVSRIQSIAAVHDLLSREDIGVATLDDVAKRVVDEASASLTPPGSRIRFHVDGHQLEVSSRQATVLALLINEMVSNAFRHGLRGRREGDIWISGRVEGGQVVVTVEDNGHGLPEDFSLERETGLGFQIIRTLVGTDLGGDVQMQQRSEGGTQVMIQFPYRPRSTRSRSG